MQLFPLDENGDVLRRMVEHGDNLSVARDIDFIIVMPCEKAALSLAGIVRSWGLKASVEHRNPVPSLPWEITVVSHMLPAHDAITQLEERLAGAATPLGGRNDGWGCLQQD